MTTRTAMDAKSPTPYGRHAISDEDIDAVLAVLRSDWLTTGPAVDAFEAALARSTDAKHACAVSSGTAALHAAMHAAGVARGDEVIVPALTFAATANAAVFQGARPVFADVDAASLLIDPENTVERITPKTRAIVAVDFAGQPCDYAALREIADDHGLVLIADACHSLGATYGTRPVGSLADLSVFSFHPVKAIATGEGGAVTTDNVELAAKIRRFRNHGLTSDARTRTEGGVWAYDMEGLGYNYRLSDIHCALGLSQLSRLSAFVQARNRLADIYDDSIGSVTGVAPPARFNDRTHAFHLYIVRIDSSECHFDRDAVFHHLREAGIQTNVHYKPVHLHSYYKREFGTGPGQHPNAEAAFEQILTLPMFPDLAPEAARRVAQLLSQTPSP